MPDWRPGKLNGETVKVKYVFPVTFRIEDLIVLVDEGPKRNPNDTGAVEIEYIPPVNFDSVIKKSPSVKWGFLVDDTEGVAKVHLDDRTHQEIKSKSEDVKSFQTPYQTIRFMCPFSIQAIVLRIKVNTFFIGRISKGNYMKYTVKT